MYNTLVIHDVDLDLLERQRKQLIDVMLNKELWNRMNHSQQEALEGVIGMLDDWSDNRYWEERLNN